MFEEKQLMYGSKVLMIVGAVNWGLVEFFNYNLVDTLKFGMDWLGMVIYGLVAASGIYAAIKYKKFLR